MRLLFTGKTESGTFIMRGQQIAAQHPSWRAALGITANELHGFDAVVVVKEVLPDVLATIKLYGIPLIYDAVDFWEQPKGLFRRRSAAQQLTRADDARAYFRPFFQQLNPNLTICVTQEMSKVLADLVSHTEVIYHHSDPRLPIAEAYRQVSRSESEKRVLYFGKRRFLKEWGRTARRACAANGAELVAQNVTKRTFGHPAAADAMLAVRGGRDGCWLSRSWKSNVKAATAARLGLPLVAWPEASYLETAPNALWFTNESELVDAIRVALAAERHEHTPQGFDVERSATDFEAAAARMLDRA